jgi:hypothetical protein
MSGSGSARLHFDPVTPRGDLVPPAAQRQPAAVVEADDEDTSTDDGSTLSSSIEFTDPAAASPSRQAPWWHVQTVADVVCEFCDGRAAFTVCRAVCRAWARAVDEHPGSAFWQHVVAGCVPSLARPAALLAMYVPLYAELRAPFSRETLRPKPALDNVLIVDMTFAPLLWFTGVALSTMVRGLVQRVAVVSLVDVTSAVVCANGRELEPRDRLGDVVFPSRQGARGWRVDLLITVGVVALADDARRVVPTPFLSPSS